mgnify:CR=1 FL=1
MPDSHGMNPSRSLADALRALPGAAGASPQPGTAPPAALGLGLGHRVVAKVADLHGATFRAVPPPAGFSHAYALDFSGGRAVA